MPYFIIIIFICSNLDIFDHLARNKNNILQSSYRWFN